MFIDQVAADWRIPQNISECVKTEFDSKQTIQSGCLVFGERPLKQAVDPSLFSDEELHAVPYDIESPRWVFEDGEPDDFANIFILPRGKSIFIAEPHRIRGEVFTRTKAFMEKLGEKDVVLQGGGVEKEINRLIAHLESLPDHSLCIEVIAPSPTLTALMKKCPELLAQKIKRISNYGGFTHRDCEYGKYAGQKVYYTTFNVTQNIEAAQALFDFSESHRVPLYIFAGDNLRFPNSIYFDVPHKYNSIPLPSAEYIAKEIQTWSKFHLKADNLRKWSKEVEAVGYPKEDVFLQMTPADAIVGVFDLSFDQLEVISRGFSHIQITDEPRYENGTAKSHRAVLLEENPDSPIRYVDGFYLKNTNLETSQTFEILLNHLINIRWHEQLQSPPPVPPKSNDFFRLSDALEETLISDAYLGVYNYEKRAALLQSFSTLQNELNPSLEDIQAGRGKFASLSQKERNALYAFASQGRGAETVRIFSKTPIDLAIDDPHYGGKIMDLANNTSLLLDERIAEQKKLLEIAKVNLKEVSDQLALQFPNKEKTSLFTRGMIGSGKSTLIENQLGIQESSIFSSDSTKLHLGGNLSHHESVAFSASLLSLDLPHKIDLKTNIRTRDNTPICHPEEGRTNIVLDVYISKEVVQQRLSQRAQKGGRVPSPDEIEEGYSLMMNNRLPIVEAALANNQIEWHLYDNNGAQHVEIANIIDRELHVIDSEKFDAIINVGFCFH